MQTPNLRHQLERGELIVAPGVFDMMSVLVANRVGFDAVYASGYWLTASYLGLPDAGLATYTDMLNRVSAVCEHAQSPVIADADTGYGGLLNVRHTVRGFERAGVAAIQIEDQEFPKQCGHVGTRRVIPTPDMVDKIHLALDTRTDDNMLLIARTDARSGLGFEEALERGSAYAEAGADIVFLEALDSESEMQLACQQVDAWMMANMAEGGATPMLNASTLQRLGYNLAIFPAISALSAMAAVEQALHDLKVKGAGAGTGQARFNFEDMCDLLGFDEVRAFESKWVARGAYDSTEK